MGQRNHLSQGGQAGFGNDTVDQDDGAGRALAVPGGRQGLDALAGFPEGARLPPNGVMDLEGSVQRDRHQLHPLGHQGVGHAVQQGAVGLNVHHKAPLLGFGQEGGEMGVKGGFAAGKIEPGPEGGYLIQEADPGGQGQFPAGVIPTQPGGARRVAVLLAHDAFQVAAPGEVEVEAHRRAA